MEEYRVKVTVRNNLLLSAIENAGYKSQSEFARACGLNVRRVHNLVTMKDCPISDTGEFSEAAKAIMEVLGAAPSDLWTEAQQFQRLTQNSSEFRMSAEEFKNILTQEYVERLTLPDPEKELEDAHLPIVVGKMVESLTPREKEFIELRFKEDMLLYEIAEHFNVSRERARQIEAKALHKLRHPSRIDLVYKYLGQPLCKDRQAPKED